MKKIEVIKGKLCPVCSSKMKPIILRRNNGIIGPGYKSWIVDAQAECIVTTCRVRVGLDNKEPVTENIEVE